MNSSEILIANINSLMLIKGMNRADISKKAAEAGLSIHKTTISNILEGKGFGTEKLDAIAYAFDLEPAYMFWTSGFNQDGKPVGIGNSVSYSTVQWAVKKVSLALSFSGIDDLDFQSTAISKLIKVASENGQDIADLEWQKLLSQYTPAN